jgi:RNA polymerase sigma-70 factor (ECF subfamily)
VAETFSGQARAARPALIDGVPGAVWAPGGEPRVAILFEFEGDTIAAVDLVADPERLSAFDLEIPSR